MIEITAEMIAAFEDVFINTAGDEDSDGLRKDYREGLEAVAPLIIAAYFKQYAGQHMPEPISAQLVSEPLAVDYRRSDALQAICTLMAGRPFDERALLDLAERAAHWIETGERPK